MAYKHAVAHIIGIYTESEILRTTLSLDWLPSSPIAPASLYEQNEKQSQVLDLHRLVARTESNLTFETYGSNFTPLTEGNAYIFISWWTPDQLQIAQDTHRAWHKQTFVPKDMVLYKRESGQIGRQVREGEIIREGTLVQGGWDHEHCCLCWKTISAHHGQMHEAYTEGNEWLCDACYTTYIVSGFGNRLGEQVS